MTNQPTASGVSEEMARRALSVLSNTDDDWPHSTRNIELMKIALKAALSAKPAQGGDDVRTECETALIEAALHWRQIHGPATMHTSSAMTEVARHAEAVIRGRNRKAQVNEPPQTAAKPPQPIPTPDKALREILLEVFEAGRQLGIDQHWGWGEKQQRIDAISAAMSRVAALSRARPEEVPENGTA